MTQTLKKSLLAATMLALAPLASQAADSQLTPLAELPAGVYKIDPTHASLTWKVNHLGLSNYTARFKTLDATVTLDPKDVSKSKLVATVNPNSIETDYPGTEKDFNKKLSQDAEWFNATKFPEIKFESTSIEKTSDTTGKIHGNLTFLGVTKPLTLNATFNGGMAEHPYAKKPAFGVSATGTLKRSEWGFTTYVPAIGDDVALSIEVELQQ